MFATDSDAVREYARNVGREDTCSAWILDPRDVWTRNPYYIGPPVAHPEDDGAYGFDGDESEELDSADYDAYLLTLAPIDEYADDFPW